MICVKSPKMKEVASLFARIAPSRTVERKVQSSNRWHWASKNSRCTNLAGVSLSRSKRLSNPGGATFVPAFNPQNVTVLSSSRTDSTGGKRQSRLPPVGRRLRRVYTSGNRDRGFQRPSKYYRNPPNHSASEGRLNFRII